MPRLSGSGISRKLLRHLSAFRGRLSPGDFRASSLACRSRNPRPHLVRPRRRRHVAACPTAGHCRHAAAARPEAGPEDADRPYRLPDGRDRQPGRLHRLVRLARRLGGEQPPLRLRRAAAELHGGKQPDRAGLPGEDPGRRTFRRPVLAHLRHRGNPRRHEGDHRQAQRRDERRRALQGDRVGDQGTGQGLRERRLPLRRLHLPRRLQLPTDQAAGDQGRAPGLRAAGIDRQVRRRHRQLDVAAPHRRLRLPARLRLEGRQVGRLLQGQRAVPAEACAQGEPARRGSGRLRDGGRLSGPHQPLSPRRRGARLDRLGLPDPNQGVRGHAGHHQRRRQG